MNKLAIAISLAAGTGAATVAALPASAQQALGNYAGDLLVSSSSYTDTGFGVGTALPYNASGTGTTSTLNTVAGSAFCANANCSSNVWNNVTTDANFGITSGIYLQNVNTSTGTVDNTVNVTQLAANAGINLATSFSSKSELAINLSPDGSSLTFMAYNAGTGQFDVSNSNTPGSLEPGNTDIQTATYRAVGQISLSSNALQVTTTNAYNGNNGRAAIAATAGGYYLVGNAGNGSGSAQTTLNTGVQFLSAATTNGGLGTNTQVGQYNITQQGYAADKTPKDNNFRGETVYNNTLYVTKGSGSNGIDTAYQVGTTGSLPTGSSNPINVLPGFNTLLAKTDTETPHPFGLWFANSTTLYVADEGSGASSDFGATPTTQAGGLDKYSLVGNTWVLDYELKGSLIGSSYTVNGSGAVCGGLSACSLTTTTDGLRNLTGKVNANGTVTLYAVTSTEGSVLGDAGADPNQIVSITDTLADTSALQVTGENYNVLDTAALGQVYRGVAVAPVPLPASAWMLLAGLGGFGFAARRKRPTA
jgi:hypothetical protein